MNPSEDQASAADQEWVSSAIRKMMVNQINNSLRNYRAFMGIPEPTDYDRSLWHEEYRRDRAAKHVEWARIHDLLASHSSLTRSLLELHTPKFSWSDSDPECDGCDFSGWEAERPDWPCRTISRLVELVEAK